MMTSILSFCGSLGRQAKQCLKQWTKPATATLVPGAMTRSRADLIAENVMLRQQLIVLNRQVKRPQLTNGDRIRLVLLARCTQFWQQALLIVQPDTLLRWHRDLFRRYWRHKSRNKRRKPRVAPETISLIKKIANENGLWGAERIRGELLKLGVRVSKRTIQKYMPKVRRNSSQMHHVVREYVDYYNHSRPHQGIGQRLPAQFPRTYPPSSGQIIATPVLGGLHHAYSRATHLH